MVVGAYEYYNHPVVKNLSFNEFDSIEDFIKLKRISRAGLCELFYNVSAFETYSSKIIQPCKMELTLNRELQQLQIIIYLRGLTIDELEDVHKRFINVLPKRLDKILKYCFVTFVN